MFREALRINPAYTEAALNLAVTCNDLGKYREAKDDLRARDGRVEERAARAWTRSRRGRSPTCTPRSAPPTTRSACTRTPCASTSGRWRCARRSSTSAPSSATPSARWATSAAPMREFERVGPRTRRFVGGRLHLGLSYYAAGRRDEAAAEWRAVLGRGARGNRAGHACTWRLARRRPGKAPPAPDDGVAPRPETSTACCALRSTLGRDVRRRGDPRLRAGRRGRAHLPLDREARPDHVEAVRRLRARLLGVDARDVGYAGMKDRHATTRQWLSIPRLDPERGARAWRSPELAVLRGRAATATSCASATCAATASRSCSPATCDGRRATLDSVARSASGCARWPRDGVPNRYGEQRFGADRRQRGAGAGACCAASGASAIIAGGGCCCRRRSRRCSTAISSCARGRRAALARCVACARRRPAEDWRRGGLFVCQRAGRRSGARRRGRGGADRADAGRRARSSRRPTASAARSSDEALLDVGATREDFARAGRELPGARRPVIVIARDARRPRASPIEPAPRRRSWRVRFGSACRGQLRTVVVDRAWSARRLRR